MLRSTVIVFSRCPLVFFSVWYTSPPSSLQRASILWHVTYGIQHIVLFLAQTPSFRFVIFDLSSWLIVLGGKSCLGSYCYLGALSFQSKHTLVFAYFEPDAPSWPIYYAILSFQPNKKRKLPVLRKWQILLLINFCRGNPWHGSDVVTCSCESWEPNPPATLMRLRFQLTLLAKAAVILGSRRMTGSAPLNWNVKSSWPKCSASTKSTTSFIFYHIVLTTCPGISTMTHGA